MARSREFTIYDARGVTGPQRLTDPQVEALGVLVNAEGPVRSARYTVGGFVATRVANALVDAGHARLVGASGYEATPAGRLAYDAAMDR